MSASIHRIESPRKMVEPVLHPVSAHALEAIKTSCADLREAIADTQSVGEAFNYYQWLKAIAVEVNSVVNAAGARCERLLERL